MTQQFQATYRGGALLPSEGVHLPLQEGDSVSVTITTRSPAKGDDLLRLCGQVYGGLTVDEIADVERIAFDRSRFFLAPSEAR